MKNFLALGAIMLFLSFAPHAVHAQACPSGNDGDCPGNEVCDTSVTPFVCVASDNAAAGAGSVGTGGACTSDGQCSGNLACIHSVCQIDPSLEDPGTAAAGGSCSPANNNADCPGGQVCIANVSGTGGTCTGSTGNASPGSASGASAGSNNFVPLAPIPGLTDQQPSNNFGTFLNNLYKYLIGLAAALAIIQIVRGGINIATQDSAEGHGKGREQITQALLGLVLVLSPVLVFSIINPSILNLSIGFKSLNLSQYKGITLPNGVLTPAQQDALPGTTNGNGQFTTTGTNTACAPGTTAGTFDCSNADTLCQENQPGGYTTSATAVCLNGGQIDTAHPPSTPTYFFGIISGSASSATSCPQAGDTLAVNCVYSGSGSGPGAYTGH